MKWLTIASLGISAYYLGFFLGFKGFAQKEIQIARMEQAKELQQLTEDSLIVLPTLEKATNLSQLK